MISKSARAAQFATPAGHVSWTLVDGDGLPIEPAESYLRVLRSLGMANNTVEAYARHLSLFWRWLDARQVAWDQITFGQLSDFLFTYRHAVAPLTTRNGADRATSSTKAVAAAIKEFYTHHRLEGRGPRDLVLTKAVRYSTKSAHHLLAHIEQRRPTEVNRLSAGFKSAPAQTKVIQFEDDFDRLIEACRSDRDRLFVSALYDLGFRVGQALGLRHSDLDIATAHVVAVRRESNVNGATSKSRGDVKVKAPARFFHYYSRYLMRELMPKRIDSDYLFVNFHGNKTGEPASYQNMYQQLAAIAKRAGIEDLNPHKLRHTHATALAKAGWTSAEIAARLGQTHAGSSDRYIHLATEDIDVRLAETEHLVWPRRMADHE